MPPQPTVPISAEERGCPDIQAAELILPLGMTTTKAWSTHSTPYLLHRFDANYCPVQLVPHCGIPEYAKAIPNGSMEALRRATIGLKGEGGNAVELDAFWIAGKPYAMHYLAGDCQTVVEGPSGQCMLEYIQQAVEGTKSDEGYVPTNSPITQLLDSMWELISLNDAVTIFLDGHNEDAAKLAALLSNHPVLSHSALVQLHPYTFQNGADFVDMVNDLNPAATWERSVALAPILNPDTLPTLAGIEQNSLDYNALYAAGQAWFTSMISTGMWIFGLGFPVSGIGHGVDLTTGKIHDLNGNLVAKPEVRAMFLWDRVLLDLVTWAKETHPILAIIMHSINYHRQCYTDAFHMGHPVAWPEGAESHGRELMAVPGNALRHGANIVICDHMNNNLNALLHTKIYTWPTDVDYSTYDVRGGARLQTLNI